MPAAAVPAPQPVFTAPYAGFWRRFAAYWIDWFIFFSIELFIAAARGIPLAARQDVESPELVKGLFLGLLIGWLYSATLESSPWQATLGKRAMDIYVTDLKGRRLGFAQASGRFFGKLLSALIFGIGFFMIAFTERKQALHDHLAGCLVVRRRE
ncbi:MAG: RDD family protein [Acidobacteria bacterium]|nr:RDD family protein [Acidobacteriota bacterium]MBI3664225.1 RDD family protein [Acidobacteriota bacterium]